MSKTMQNYNESESIKKTWDFAQNNFYCCGTSAYKDWKNMSCYVPKSCYKRDLHKLRYQKRQTNCSLKVNRTLPEHPLILTPDTLFNSLIPRI